MKTSWGKRIGILAAGIGFLMLAGFILFAPQKSLAQGTGCQPGTHPDPNGLGCIPDTISCPAGQHQSGSGCVADEPWCPEGQHPSGSGCAPDTVSCPAGQHQGESGVCVADEPGSGLPAGTVATGQPPAEPQDIDCGGWLSPDLNCVIGRLFYYVIYSTFGFLVWVSAMFLELVIKLTILDFHNWVALPGIRIAWTVLRDTMNITFIFLLLYASISMILGLGKEKGIVKGVILAGLLINFSFFFTSVIIDASNVLTVQMHDAIKRIGDNIEAGEDNSVVGTPGGITAVFMQGTGIQVAAIQNLGEGSFVATLLQQMIFSSITFLVLAFVFFAMGFLLLGRFIVLLILLITSPISVMGGLFPQIATHSKKWWKALIDQAVFAPIMMLFLVVTAVIVSNPQFRGGFSRDSVPGLVGGVGGLVQYAIVVGLLIMGIVIAKSTAGAASNGAANWAIKKAQSVASAPGRWAGAAAGGISGAIGRNTVGAGAKWAGEKYDLTMGKWSQANIAGTEGWRKGLVPFKRFAAGTARNTGLDEGLRDTFKDVAGLKFGSQQSLAEREKARIQRTKELGQAVKEADVDAIINAGIERTAEDLNKKTYDSSSEKMVEYLKTVAKITDREIEEMLATGQIDKLKKLAPDLTSKHMDKIMSSDLISDSVKTDIGKRRESGMLERINTEDVKVKNIAKEADRIAKGKPNEVAQLPTDVLKNAEVASRLTIGTLSKIATDGKVSDTDRAAIKQSIEDKLAALNTLPISASLEEHQQAADQIDQIEKSLAWFKSDAGKIF